MSTATAAPLMTIAEFLALPEDDGVERWLINGELREHSSMTRRNRFHSRVTVRIARFLDEWNDTQATPGEVFAGELGVLLARDPDTTVGIDVAYVAADVLARQTGDTTLIDGPPVLAVEIQSPSDTIEAIQEKADAYLAAGVPLVWLVNPYLKTVTVLRPGADAEPLGVADELTAEPHLPGFRVAVGRLFA